MLRLLGVGGLEIFGDEAAYSFRAVGYLDYLGTNFQTQPIEWYKDVSLPFWTNLSFHDSPPLAILIQHIFFRFFGDSLLVARLPAVLFGIAAAAIFYLLMANRRSKALTLLALFLFSINSALVWIFRTSLLEPTLIFFILFNIYLFFKFLDDRRYWWLFGGTLGLIALTKYTGIFIIPVYIVYLLIQERLIFKNWRLYGAFIIALLISTPVIIYNVYLFKATGHFDLQISYLLGQSTPEWTGLLGKIQSPFSDFWENLTVLYGLPFLITAFIGVLSSIAIFIKNRQYRGSLLFLWLYVIFATLLFVKIGVADRFIILYALPLVAFVALAFGFAWGILQNSRWKYIVALSVIVFFIFEILFMLQKNFINVPDYGIAKLDSYLRKELDSRESAVIPQANNPHLNKLINKFAEQQSGGQSSFFAVIYNDNIALTTLEWVFYRRFFYHSTPTFYVENFLEVLQREGSAYFQGFDLYFVQSAPGTLLNGFKKEKTVGSQFEKWLANRWVTREVIQNRNGEEMFRVYKFSLE